jgi:GWxTD domain-containing protein
MIYHPGTLSLNPEAKVYNTSDTSSLLLVKIAARELLFNLANVDRELLANVEVYYSLYDLNGEKEKELVDSATTTFRFKKDPKIEYHRLKIDLATQPGKEYLLEVRITDQNRDHQQYAFLKIDRKQNYALQDFIVQQKMENEWLVHPWITGDVFFKIAHYKDSLDSLKVFYFPLTDKIPVSPDQNDSVPEVYSQPDTSWMCYPDSLDYDNFSGKGMYYFSVHDKPEDGLALFNFGKYFPEIRTPDELFNPLAYLQEIDTMFVGDTTGKYKKLYVDHFWLQRAKNMERSRELIKLFYNRVYYANLYFTSHVEGWRTDRGMIYIVYGLPDYVHKSGGEERWIYHHDAMGPGIIFYFYNQQNPYSLNHFVLDREKIKSTEWDAFLELWNSGEIIYTSPEGYR